MKKNILAAIKLVLIIIATCALVFFTSCTCKSSQTIVEKVVILDSIPLPVQQWGGDPVYQYKVKRITKGVMAYIEVDYLFDIGDTIFYEFIPQP